MAGFRNCGVSGVMRVWRRPAGVLTWSTNDNSDGWNKAPWRRPSTCIFKNSIGKKTDPLIWISYTWLFRERRIRLQAASVYSEVWRSCYGTQFCIVGTKDGSLMTAQTETWQLALSSSDRITVEKNSNSLNLSTSGDFFALEQLRWYQTATWNFGAHMPILVSSSIVPLLELSYKIVNSKDTIEVISETSSPDNASGFSE